MQKYLWIAIGGALGAVARYGVDALVAGRLGTKFPYGTLIVNITACFFIGFALVFIGARSGLGPAWRFLIAIGFVGSYSTFSTFEWETFAGLQTGAIASTILYVALSFSVGLFAVWGGARLASGMTQSETVGFDRSGATQVHYPVTHEDTGLHQAGPAEGRSAQAE